MSSSNKKTFKTSESSKQAGTTVTSDAILLDPTTTDHILVVTADSSANLSGNVDVELEMSPDGQNWCPAQIKSTTTTAGGTTTTDPIVGNEKAVDLTADPASTSEYKNKFARGRLEYYISTNQEYTGSTVDERQRADAADFMHHMIGTTKNFNYSGWYKSDVQPSTTYTPVLFRNGGIDPFENTQVVDLTDSVTQNLCNALNNNNEYALRISDDSTTGSSPQYFEMTNSSGTFINPFKLSTETDPDNLPSLSIGTSAGSSTTEGIVLSANIRRASAPVGTAYNTKTLWKVYVNDAQGNPAGFWTTMFSYTNSSLYTGFYDNLGNFLYYTANLVSGTLLNGNWHHISQQFAVNAPGIGTNLSYYCRISVDGATPGVGSGTTGSTIAQPDWSTYTVSRVVLGGGNDAVNNYHFDLDMDNVCFYTGFLNTNNNWTSIYNARKNPLSFSSPNMVLKSCFTMGDKDDDRANFIFKDIVEPSSGRQFVQSSTNAATPAPVVLTLTSADDPYVLLTEGNQFSSVFNTTSAFSVSGWFKTEVGATGTLFSNGPLASLAGLSLDITSSTYMSLTLGTYSPHAINFAPVSLNDGNWHHIVLTRTTTGTYGIYVDGKSKGIAGYPNVDPKGSYGFTLLGDGQNNVTATNPSSTDPSKLNASLSNWSIHSEAFSAAAIAQLYSNGHVRNIKNLPSVNPANIVSWWQLNDSANPEQDSSGNGHHLTYQDGHTITETLVQQLVLATGATLVQNTLNGHGITLSLTKNFDYSTGWVSDASGEASICLSFNGFERDAEFTALWKCNQVSKGINLLDGNWHNIILSYRGKNDSQSSDETTSSYVQEGDIVRFGPDTTAQNFNFNLSIDGVELNDINNGIGADQIFGIDPSVLINNGTNYTGFRIYNRHLKFTDHPEESYMAHTQGGATNIIVSPSGIRQPATDLDNPWSFQGIIDETSFHSQNFWESSGGIDPNNFESEYPATIYGNTNALTGTRGAGSTYDVGVPYPLNDPTTIGTAVGMSQYINPNRYDAVTNPGGGLEAWWRWGDTPQDCAENINDVMDHAVSTPEALVTNHHLRAVEIDQNDLYPLSTSDSTYLANVAGGTTTTPGSSVTEFISVIIEGLVDTACNVKNLSSPILQYLRVKFTGSGSVDLGQGKAEASLWWKKRRTK